MSCCCFLTVSHITSKDQLYTCRFCVGLFCLHEHQALKAKSAVCQCEVCCIWDRTWPKRNHTHGWGLTPAVYRSSSDVCLVAPMLNSLHYDRLFTFSICLIFSTVGCDMHLSFSSSGQHNKCQDRYDVMMSSLMCGNTLVLLRWNWWDFSKTFQ